jgi:hypothetical protein
MSSEQKKYDCKKMEVKRMNCKEDRQNGGQENELPRR